MRKFWIFIFLISSIQLKAQEIFRIDQHPEVEIDGVILSSPFTGGINSAQIQTLDLTGDGIEEWVTWDINSRQLLIFEKDGDNFIHLPELGYLFPADINGFLVLVDFDEDGKKDLFTSTALGIRAYRNTSAGNNISWEVAQNFLRLDGSGNIQTNNLDTPLIQDLDGDGDLDLVIFNFAGGDYMEFYKNTSIERKGTADVDGFAFGVDHWGNFEFCGCGEISFGKTCEGQDLNSRKEPYDGNRILHAGGHSILYKDFDGDGIEDLVLGRDECSVLYFLPNSGSSTNPVFTSYTNTLPGYGDFPEFPIFHVGQLFGDDLVVSLNTSENSFNFGIDFAHSIVKIDNQGNADYEFLQDQMIDLGENARPIFLGNKSLGELLVTSNFHSEEGLAKSRLTSFTMANGKLTQQAVENDKLSSLNLFDAQYISFRDKIGNTNLLASGIVYQNNIPTQLIYDLLEEASDPISIAGYSPQRGDYLQFFNYQQEDYMLVAAQNGSLDLYTFDFGNFTASLVESDFLGFVDNPATRNLSVAVENSSSPNLYAIDQNGVILKIIDFMNLGSRTEVLVQIGEESMPTQLGRNTWITLVDSPFGDSPDLLLGTRAGGLIYLTATDSADIPAGEYQYKVYPNPAEGPIKVIVNAPAKAQLINSLGQVLLSEIDVPANQVVEIQAGFLTPGLYIIFLEIDGKVTRSAKIWMR
ncbi:T9SS type A sorting domain-containing protein [Algoriphagus sp. D3-2-R+10]|uniref:T9SS type A sorting domain-containing protein n=1 Tax=Algoriphagus aurantiacus TaxID=3103948 RepID=UPI002B37F024|nr:T9SS type A sorting domain-containing protein [Algoriphagus sp. D3-2-R+10]MEB2775753.1 T9SS type A sorting domain-containing protein [Algoriphagus sp. D3-2-R+10]